MYLRKSARSDDLVSLFGEPELEPELKNGASWLKYPGNVNFKLAK